MITDARIIKLKKESILKIFPVKTFVFNSGSPKDMGTNYLIMATILEAGS